MQSISTTPTALRALLAVADVVLNSSRPAALAHRGLGPDDVPARDGRVWLRITGHGADGAGADWVAFGDDAAVAGGLVGRSADGPVFCADAIADPLTGLEAAAAVIDALARGGGEVIDVAMSAVAASYAALPQRQAKATVPHCHPRHRWCSRLPPSSAPTTPSSNEWSPNGGSPHADSACTPAGRHGGRHPCRATNRRRGRASHARRRARRCSTRAAHAVIPGLHDHHVHLHSAAAALTSVSVGPREVHGRADLARVLSAASVGEDGWIRAVGYHEAVAGPLDRTVLDDVSPAVPVRVQHRSGVLWTLNSAGLARVGLPDHPDGRLRSADPNWSNALQRREIGLAEVSRRLASYGVTGVTDATPDLGVDDVVKFAEAHRRGDLLQSVTLPGARQADPARRRPRPRRADRRGSLDVTTRTQRWPCTASRRPSSSSPSPHSTRRVRGPGTASSTPPSCPTTALPIWPGSACWSRRNRTSSPSAVISTSPTYPPTSTTSCGAWRRCWPPTSRWCCPPTCRSVMPTRGRRCAPRCVAPPRRARSSGPPNASTPAPPCTMFLGEADRPTETRTVAPGAPANLCVTAAAPDELLHELDADMVAATIIEGSVVSERS